MKKKPRSTKLKGLGANLLRKLKNRKKLKSLSSKVRSTTYKIGPHVTNAGNGANWAKNC